MSSANTLEVEGKILDINYEELVRKISNMDAILVCTWTLRAQWLININGEKLRVRQEWTKISVEHKEFRKSDISGIKTNNETGFEADSFDNIINTLLKVWLKRHWLLSVKSRVSFLLQWKNQGVKLDIDTYHNLQWESIPSLLEIEASSHEIVVKVAGLLGYSESDLKDYGPIELLRHYYPNKTIV